MIDLAQPIQKILPLSVGMSILGVRDQRSEVGDQRKSYAQSER